MSTFKLLGAGAALALLSYAPALAQVAPAPGAQPAAGAPAGGTASSPANERDSLYNPYRYGLPLQISPRDSVDKDTGAPIPVDTDQRLAALHRKYGGTPEGLQRAVDDVRWLAVDDQESCSTLSENYDEQLALDKELEALIADLMKEPKKQRRWTIGRFLLGMVQVGAAVAMPGMDRTAKIAYALMVAAGQAQATGDRVEHARIMGLWTKFMMHHTKQVRLYSNRSKLWEVRFASWCTTMNAYDKRYSLVRMSTVSSFTPAAATTSTTVTTTTAPAQPAAGRRTESRVNY